MMMMETNINHYDKNQTASQPTIHREREREREPSRERKHDSKNK